MSDTYQPEGREIFEKRQTENRKNKADTENNPYEQDQPAFLYQGESFLRTALLNRIDHPAWLRNYNPEHLAQYGDHYEKLQEQLLLYYKCRRKYYLPSQPGDAGTEAGHSGNCQHNERD